MSQQEQQQQTDRITVQGFYHIIDLLSPEERTMFQNDLQNVVDSWFRHKMLAQIAAFQGLVNMNGNIPQPEQAETKVE